MNSRKGKKNIISPGYGMPDYYNYYKNKYKSDISKNLYRKIICEFNSEIAKAIILNNFDFEIPYRLGKLSLRKFKPLLKISNNKLINHNPPDFKKTKELWEKDPEARKKKILIRFLNKHTNGYLFEIKYYNYKANFKNKSAYTFTVVRSVTKFISYASHNYNLEALIR